MTIKTALVTGGNRGIGREVCRQMAQNGWKIFLAARTLDNANRAAEECKAEGLDVSPIALDISSEESILSATRQLSALTESLDALVNNAGIFLDRDGDGMAFSKASVMSSFETNTVGPLLLSRALLPLLSVNKNSQIVNVSSGMGQLSTMRDGHLAYRISKAALNAVTLALSAELSDRPIAVNSVCPGWVHTDMGGKNAPLTPAEGADTIVWLASGGAGRASGGFYRNRAIIAW